MPKEFSEDQVRAALLQAWSLQTARQWTKDTPAAGQCNVTAVVVHDLFGGEILRTRVPGHDVDHYYNAIDGQPVDLTDSQFREPVSYDNEVATRDDAMACVRPTEYEILKASLLAQLK